MGEVARGGMEEEMGRRKVEEGGIVSCDIREVEGEEKEELKFCNFLLFILVLNM